MQSLQTLVDEYGERAKEKMEHDYSASYIIVLLTLRQRIYQIEIATLHIISLGTLVPNSRNRQGKLWPPNILENNLTITCPSNTGHKSLSTELLAP